MKTISVLLVSGQYDDYQFLYELLKRSKRVLFCVDWAESFVAGQMALRKTNYDIAMVEDHFEQMRGSQFVSQAEQNGIKVPIILFTCSECWVGDDNAFQSNAIYCLVKEKMTTEMIENIILREMDWKLTSSIMQF